MAAAGHEIYFVGGCVRNALLNRADSDVDLSTSALPEHTIAVAEQAGFKAIPTGLDHGTVTVVVGDVPFEITTFRRDVATDGRRAVVAFSKDVEDDARRRDFTMNALYSTDKGRVIDPLGSGVADAFAGRLRFIEDPARRIQEDYLRILRFFRFFAWYARPEDGFDPDAIAAIGENLSGLETLSRERVGQEMIKLLRAADPGLAVAGMRQTGVLHKILPGSDDRLLLLVPHFEQSLGLLPSWTTRLAALGGETPSSRLRLSKADAQTLDTLSKVAFSGPSLSEIAYRHGVELATSSLLLRAALSETMPEKAVLETIDTASRAQFPVSAKDLMPEFQGPELGAKLKALEERWIASDFTLTAKELLE